MKKRTFALIEVIIAVVLVTTACFFLLDFENILIHKTKKSVQDLEKERLTQQASVLLFEKLSTHQIGWETVANEQSCEMPLDASKWVVKYDFSIPKTLRSFSSDLLRATATISLRHAERSFEKAAELPLYLKKEEGGNVIAMLSQKKT